MSGPINGTERQYDETRYSDAFNEIQVSTPRVWGAALHEAFLDNPEMSIFRLSENDVARGHVPRIATAAAGVMIPGLGPQGADIMSDVADRFMPKPERISEDDFNNSYAQLGLKWDNAMTKDMAEILASRKRRELRNLDIMSRGDGGAVENVGKFGSALVASLLSPANIAISFIPVVGEGRWASWVAKYGVTKARLARGALEGLIGQAAVEPLTFGARTEEQADYTAMNSLANVTMGLVMGAGLHTIGGKIHDLMASGREIQADLRATDVAARQLADGRAVDVGPVHLINTAEVDHARAQFRIAEEGGTPDVGSPTALRDIETQAVDGARETVRAQQAPERSLDVTPESLAPLDAPRDRSIEAPLDAVTKDIEEANARLQEVSGGKPLDELEKKFISEADEAVKAADIKAKALNTAIDCVMGEG